MRILLIEEDEELTEMIRDMLVDAGFHCDRVNYLIDGEFYFGVRYYDLVLVDWNLAESKEFIRTVRNRQPQALIITLSGDDDSKIELEALHEGVDDYVRKPFDMDVLLERIEARLRRSVVSHLIEIEDLVINTADKTVSHQGRIIELKGKGFEVLVHLVIRRGLIISKEQLLDANWLEPELVSPNVIEAAVNRIRQMIDKPLGITTIKTVRSRGYRFLLSRLTVTPPLV